MAKRIRAGRGLLLIPYRVQDPSHSRRGFLTSNKTNRRRRVRKGKRGKRVERRTREGI